MSQAHYMPLDDFDELADDNPGPETFDDAIAEDPYPSRLDQLRSYQSRFHLPRIPIRLKCELTKTQKIVRDVVLCVLCLLIIPGVCLFMGAYTVFLHKPAPVIDKSYNAFQIPNHEASLNFAALKMAEKNHTPFSAVYFGYGYRPSSYVPYRGGSQHLTGGKAGGQFDHSTAGRKKRSVSEKNSQEESVQKLEFQSQLRLKRSNTLVEVPRQWRPIWKMQVVFLAGDGENIFTEERLKKIHEVEKAIMKQDDFPNFCYKDSSIVNKDPTVKVYGGCAPLNSLLTYFFPSKDETGKIHYDGLGDNIANVDSALDLAMQSDHFYFYVDDKVNSTNRKSQLLRTEVLFGAPLKGFMSPYADKQQQTDLYKGFVVKYIDVLSQASTHDITVLYGGNEIFDYEVEMTFWNDVRLALFSLIAIVVLMLVLTYGSLWLTVCGIVSIICSIPLAAFFYRIVFKIVGLGILNGAAVFVIIGIGVDDVFVFINVFRQASHISDVREKTVYTIFTAGKATFFTSFTTAAAFAANIASMIPAVHDFGLFMSLIVSSCWVTVMLIMPPALYIWARSCSHCETCFTSRCVCKSSSRKLTLPEDVAGFMDRSHGEIEVASIGRRVTEDVDVPMLSIDLSTQYGDSDEERDEPLLSLDPDPLYSPEEAERDRRGKRDQLGSCLQALIYHYMALPIIKARWGIIVVSTLVLVTCGGLMSQLHPSTRPPQFFRSDSNMQKLLDLKAKYSTFDTVHCDQCSAIYSVDESNPLPEPVTRHPVTTAMPLPTTKKVPVTIPATVRPTVPIPTSHKITQKMTPKPRPTTQKTTPRPPTHQPPTTYKAPTHDNAGHYWTPAPHPTPQSQGQPHSVSGNYNPCKDNDCSHPTQRPLLESGATVYVVFGVKDYRLMEKNVGHVMDEAKGVLEYDKKFSDMLNFTSLNSTLEGMRQLCRLCKRIAQNSDLVRNGSAQCLPAASMSVKTLLKSVRECQNLPRTSYIYGRQEPAHAVGSLTRDRKAVLWLGFAFESTTSKGQSYFEAYQQYQKWEDFLRHIKTNELASDSPLQDMFQTSEFWPEVLMEVVAVNSAIYSVVLSLVICLVSVAIFTRHFMLLFVVFISILEMVCCVVGIFYLLGWEIGGVEAVSLSILVGSSVDYCVHLVEGYLLAAAACPVKDNAAKARQWRTSAAFSHIGLSIISSALTTIIAVVPLTQTAIQPFAKFGQIIAINTTVCIVYSLTVCTAFLSTIAPAYFKPTWKSLVKSVFGTCVVIGTVVMTLFILFKCGIDIQGPNGASLFPK